MRRNSIHELRYDSVLTAPGEPAAVPPLVRLPRGRHQRGHDRAPPQRRRRLQLWRRPHQQAPEVLV